MSFTNSLSRVHVRIVVCVRSVEDSWLVFASHHLSYLGPIPVVISDNGAFTKLVADARFVTNITNCHCLNNVGKNILAL